MDAEFACARAEQVAADANVVSEIEQAVKFESFFSNRIFLYVNLQLLPALLQVGEPRLAHQPDSHNASRNPHLDSRILQLLRRLGRVFRQNCGNSVSELVLSRINSLP